MSGENIQRACFKVGEVGVKSFVAYISYRYAYKCTCQSTSWHHAHSGRDRLAQYDDERGHVRIMKLAQVAAEAPGVL